MMSWRCWPGCWTRPVQRGPVVVSAVAGLAGVGKTTLAVEAGHAAMKRGWFGGGVLFIDLHGYDEAPVEPAQALDALLRALGVPAEHIPPAAEERAGLYRSVLAQIADPVLVIADNASSEAQVRPLLPGAGTAQGAGHLPAHPSRARRPAGGRDGPRRGGGGRPAGCGAALGPPRRRPDQR